LLSIPNFLTILRICLIPLIIKFFLQGELLTSGIFLIISALSDFLDGYLARKYGLTTKLGRILDPLADKLTIISVLSVLIYLEIIPRLITIILLTREIFIFISSAITYFMGIDIINPSNIGKFSVFLLYLALIFSLLEINYYVDLALFYIVIPLNIISALDYILTAVRKLSN
jgi:CDP-diacylglycerol--glycerol-3-phosphate 3-phosphatidyltransferase